VRKSRRPPKRRDQRTSAPLGADRFPLLIVPDNPESRASASLFVAAVMPHVRVEVVTAHAVKRRCQILPRSPIGIPLHEYFAARWMRAHEYRWVLGGCRNAPHL
jgi:hypothetical protein